MNNGLVLLAFVAFLAQVALVAFQRERIRDKVLPEALLGVNKDTESDALVCSRCALTNGETVNIFILQSLK